MFIFVNRCSGAFGVVALASSILLGCDSSVDEAVSRAGRVSADETGDLGQRLQPQATRAGFVRFVGPELQESGAAQILIQRFETEVSAEVRYAIVEALPRIQSNADWTQTAVQWMQSEQDSLVRRGLMESTKRSKGPDFVTQSLLSRGLDDQDEHVRAASAHSLGWIVGNRESERSSEPVLSEELRFKLMASTRDASARVRSAAVDAVGKLGLMRDVRVLQAIADTDIDDGVRYRAMKAMARIDPSAAESTSQRRGDRNAKRLKELQIRSDELRDENERIEKP